MAMNYWKIAKCMVGKDVGDSELEVPLMLRDTLKVIAATSTCTGVN